MAAQIKNTEIAVSNTIPSASDMALWGEVVNKALKHFSDKDWHYSRIKLILCRLEEVTSPYLLGIDWLDMRRKQGQVEFKALQDEIVWGECHSNELGMLEIASLRLNRALLEVSTTEDWHGVRPMIRLQKRTALLQKGQTHAFFYDVEEVQGEEFENR